MEKIEKIIEEIDSLTVVELNDLVKAIEEKYGVSAVAAAAPLNDLVKAIEEKYGVSAVAAAAPAAAGAAGEAAEEKSSYDVVLTEAGDQKIKVIKVVRDATGLGLKEAKELVDGAPKTVKEGASKEEAEELKAKFTEVGAVVELK